MYLNIPTVTEKISFHNAYTVNNLNISKKFYYDFLEELTAILRLKWKSI
jgi:extradiol dioxygenase family protein